MLKRNPILILAILICGLFTAQAVNAVPQCLGLVYEGEQCMAVTDKNVYGEAMSLCCNDPVTGFYRNGFCQTGAEDLGTHVACAVVTDEFLEFSKSRGNDLITPMPDYRFPGLKAGDKWCLCAMRWKEAMDAGVAPPLDLSATHEKMLDYVSLAELEAYTQSPALQDRDT